MTGTRLMDLDPRWIDEFVVASGRLGPIAQRHSEQRGEPIASLAQSFQLLNHPAFADLRTEWALTSKVDWLRPREVPVPLVRADQRSVALLSRLFA